MRRCFLLLLALMLVLSGCAEETSPTVSPSGSLQITTTPTTEPTTAPPETGLYDPTSEIEAQTQGAVKAYPLEEEGYSGVVAMGENYVLFRSGETTTLTLLIGEMLEPVRTVTVECCIAPDYNLLHVDETGLIYFDETACAVVSLGESLAEISRLQMPADLTGTVCLSGDTNTVYYCTSTAVRALDLETGISRMLKEQSGTWQSITGIFADGEYLRVAGESEESGYHTVMISTKTGEMVWEDECLDSLEGWGNRYFVPIGNGSVTEMIFGNVDAEPQVIWPRGEGWGFKPLLELPALITFNWSGGGTCFDYYDLSSGLRTGSVTLPEYDSVWGIRGSNGKVWFCVYDMDASRDILCCWDPEMSSAQDEKVYSARRYTREDPDTASLTRLQLQADALGEQYGVDILLGEPVYELEPWDYWFASEYLVAAYEKYLPLLENALQTFPEGFFEQAAGSVGSGRIHILLVRGIYGGEAWGTLDQADGIQYWRDSEVYIALALGYGLDQNFYHEIAHIIDTRILSVSTALDEWDELNPDGFAYDNDYIANKYREDYQYLEGDYMAFIDMYAMSYAKEDRARIMEYACMSGNEEYFQSQTMQKKLRTWCLGIRETFDLEDHSQPLLWEQYLSEPI